MNSYILSPECIVEIFEDHIKIWSSKEKIKYQRIAIIRPKS